MGDIQSLEDKVVEVLKTIFDPEIPIDIYELGLIYKVRIEDPDQVYIKMTLTSPQCPVAESLPIEVESKVNALEEVSRAFVEIVWEPPWNSEMMSEAAKLELGFL